MGKNMLYFGDCLDIMQEDMNDQSVDLIYLDPPFNSKRLYNAYIGGAQWVAFDDTWRWSEAADDFHEVAQDTALASTMEGLRLVLGEGSNLAYLSYMANRLRECKRVLKDTGSIYLHCDPTMSHYLKVVMDGVFGQRNFRNEITWRRNESGAKGSQHSPSTWGSNADVILFYSKSSKIVFEPRNKELSQEDIKRLFPKVSEAGERYNTKMTAWRSPSMGPRPNLCYEFQGICPPYPSGWRLSRERMQDEYDKGNIVVKNGKLERRSYLRDYRGVSPGNVWTDTSLLLGAQSSERLGYPTQKPVALLERILNASSNSGDTVLDPFAGCGTTIEAAMRLNRRWVGIDVCVNACKIIEDRLKRRYEDIAFQIDFNGMPKTGADALVLARREPFKFERWAASLVDGVSPNKKQVGDGGIDGHGRFPIRKGVFLDVVSQVKGGKTQPRDVQAFNHARQQFNAELGIFTCFEDRVTQGMRDVAASAGKFKGVPCVQIYTIEDYFSGRRVEIPLAA